MLTTYLTQTRRLLANPAASTNLYTDADLTAYINTARGQLAGEGECIRLMGTLTLAAATQVYAFSSITLSSTAGVSGVFNVRGALVTVASGATWLRPRSFPYFQLYFLNNPVPQAGIPLEYSQFSQGISGSLYFNPVPDQPYTVTLDCVCEPATLTSDTTTEAIPYPFTDAVPYFAAYMAYLSGQRSGDADHMFQLYQTFMQRARQIANGTVNPGQYPQQGNPVRTGQLGQANQQRGQ